VERTKDLDFAAVGDDDFLVRFACGGAKPLYRVDNFHTFDDVAEDHVLIVQPTGLDGANEELGAVGVWTGISHGEDARAGVLQLEVFIRELFAVDGLAASPITLGEVASLKHKLRDDAMEGGILESKTMLAGT